MSSHFYLSKKPRLWKGENNSVNHCIDIPLFLFFICQSQPHLATRAFPFPLPPLGSGTTNQASPHLLVCPVQSSLIQSMSYAFNAHPGYQNNKKTIKVLSLPLVPSDPTLSSKRNTHLFLIHPRPLKYKRDVRIHLHPQCPYDPFPRPRPFNSPRAHRRDTLPILQRHDIGVHR